MRNGPYLVTGTYVNEYGKDYFTFYCSIEEVEMHCPVMKDSVAMGKWIDVEFVLYSADPVIVTYHIIDAPMSTMYDVTYGTLEIYAQLPVEKHDQKPNSCNICFVTCLHLGRIAMFYEEEQWNYLKSLNGGWVYASICMPTSYSFVESTKSLFVIKALHYPVPEDEQQAARRAKLKDRLDKLSLEFNNRKGGGQAAQ
ncbi:hypothetical protein L596_009931 [Steinernema carpocapsae]|uniref:Uncharacterized protein n=1 Tax=Steinernema carpocapsae TaxID=34508 RepID=A0A4U5PHK7_STECR|nr:hypothetical protein L596_009931 [Steinernema carpocapsae]